MRQCISWFLVALGTFVGAAELYSKESYDLLPAVDLSHADCLVVMDYFSDNMDRIAEGDNARWSVSYLLDALPPGTNLALIQVAGGNSSGRVVGERVPELPLSPLLSPTDKLWIRQAVCEAVDVGPHDLGSAIESALGAIDALNPVREVNLVIITSGRNETFGNALVAAERIRSVGMTRSNVIGCTTNEKAKVLLRSLAFAGSGDADQVQFVKDRREVPIAIAPIVRNYAPTVSAPHLDGSAAGVAHLIASEEMPIPGTVFGTPVTAGVVEQEIPVPGPDMGIRPLCDYPIETASSDATDEIAELKQELHDLQMRWDLWRIAAIVAGLTALFLLLGLIWALASFASNRSGMASPAVVYSPITTPTGPVFGPNLMSTPAGQSGQDRLPNGQFRGESGIGQTPKDESKHKCETIELGKKQLKKTDVVWSTANPTEKRPCGSTPTNKISTILRVVSAKVCGPPDLLAGAKECAKAAASPASQLEKILADPQAALKEFYEEDFKKCLRGKYSGREGEISIALEQSETEPADRA